MDDGVPCMGSGLVDGAGRSYVGCPKLWMEGLG